MAKKKATPAPPVQIPAETLTGLHAACRNGDADALLGWADASEEAGDGESAALLRQLPRARDVMAKELRKWRKHDPDGGSISIGCRPKTEPSWFCGDGEQEGTEADVVFEAVG